VAPVSRPERVRIHYRRLPDAEEIFDQRLVLERSDVIVTVTDPLALERPVRAGGHVVLEPRARAVWFTFPGAWHDVGRFHLADGTFTGYYANILTPPILEGCEWRTTDLFLDIWVPARGGPAEVLDEDELVRALEAGHVDRHTAERARAEAEHLLGLAAGGMWPPRIAREWTLARIEAEEQAARRFGQPR
jgi:predicted RNA-binding protein associated with RNAse of E/G family